MEENKIVETKETGKLTAIERFVNTVVGSYYQNNSIVTERERDLIRGYFVGIESVLREKRYGWNTVDVPKLSIQLKRFAKLGLNMQEPNELTAIPFRNSDTGVVTVNLITGYEGAKRIAKKFAYEPYEDIIVRLVGKNDKFQPLFRDANQDYDDYIYEQTNPFDKGEIIGGFAYIKYADKSKNKLIIMSLDEIKKHEPKKGSSFWRGEWKEKMYLKTLIKEICKTVEIDSAKLQEYKDIMQDTEAAELNIINAESQIEADNKMNKGDFIDIEYEEDIESETAEQIDGINEEENSKEA